MKKPLPPAPLPGPGSGATARARPSFPARLPVTASVQPARQAVAVPSAPPAGVAPVRDVQMGAVGAQAMRQAMVQKLQRQGLRHPAVLAAMQSVERHRFVDSALANQAYEDTSLPIGQGQTISKPNVVARMLELLCEGRSDRLGRVLDIGTGCGYQAAVLSHLAREVYTIERLRALHDRARANLRPFRLANVHLLLGDGMLGYPDGAPYAAIVAAAGGEAIPQAWIDQLAEGGRLVAPASFGPGQQRLVVIDKTPAGLKQQVLEPVLFVPLKSGVS
ncbi:MAG: protein-L-isoaspartate(D-aspartate) O-methyltransferase [Gammaproteobacteria bacterium]